MKKLLLLPLLAIMFVGCYGDDFDRIELRDDQLQQQLDTAYALLAQADEDLAAANAVIAANVAANATAIEAGDTANAAAIAQVESDIAEVELDITSLRNQIAYLQAVARGQSTTDAGLRSDIEALQATLDDLEDDLGDLEDDLEDLEDDVDDLDDDVNTIVWTPTFSAQTVAFTQTGTSVTGTTSRVIAIGTTTSTVVINAIEHQHNVDINGDRDQADSIRRSRIDTLYTGTVSGSTLVVGSHTVTGTLTPWVVIDNN